MSEADAAARSAAGVAILDNSHRITSFFKLSPFAAHSKGYNCRIQDYGDRVKIAVFSRELFVCPERDGERAPRGEGAPRDRDDSRRRAMNRVFDIAALNSWDWWVTLTFNNAVQNRHDHSAVMSVTRAWLSNMVQRRGAKYLMVWERHNVDREGWHAHLLYSGELPVEASGYQDRGGHDIYNVTAWRRGWSTAIKVYEDGSRLAAYMTKYMTKGTEKLAGKWYWTGGELVREPPTSYCSVEWVDVDGKEVFVPEAGMSVKYIDLVRNAAGELELLTKCAS